MSKIDLRENMYFLIESNCKFLHSKNNDIKPSLKKKILHCSCDLSEIIEDLHVLTIEILNLENQNVSNSIKTTKLKR